MPDPMDFASAFPPVAFDDLINKVGVSIHHQKSHECPCMGDTGNPNSSCPVCQGIGFYWDPATGPWTVLFTMMTWVTRNVDIGMSMDTDAGPIIQGDPVLTVAYTYTPVLWQNIATYDAVVEMGATMRFNATLRVGQNTSIPYVGAFSVAPTGAVTIWDPVTSQPLSGVTYTVSGTNVTLPATYGTGTVYVVEYIGSPTFIIFNEMGGLSHTRPFGQGGNYPRRFRIQALDLFLRNRMPSSSALKGVT